MVLLRLLSLVMPLLSFLVPTKKMMTIRMITCSNRKARIHLVRSSISNPNASQRLSDCSKTMMMLVNIERMATSWYDPVR